MTTPRPSHPTQLAAHTAITVPQRRQISIARMTDVRLDDGGDPAPDWRAPFRTPVPSPEVH